MSETATKKRERGVEVFVPGRICLLGEHSDWAGAYRRFNQAIVPGRCLVSGINQGLYARCRPHASILRVTGVDHKGNKSGPWEVPMEPNALLEAANSGCHFAYVAGVALVPTPGLYQECHLPPTILSPAYPRTATKACVFLARVSGVGAGIAAQLPSEHPLPRARA